MKRPPWGIFVLVLTISVFLTGIYSPLDAQPAIDSAHYKYYRPYDSVFRLVGTNIAHMDVARAFRLDYVRGYNAFSATDLHRTINHPNGNLETVQGNFYLQAYGIGFKLIRPVTNAGIDLKNTCKPRNIRYRIYQCMRENIIVVIPC